MEGHALVVHDAAGAPIACSILSGGGQPAQSLPPAVLVRGSAAVLTGSEPWRSGLLVTEFSPYRNYAGLFAHVWGTIKVVSSRKRQGTQYIQWFLHGVDVNCGHADTAGIPDACGVHIHSGWGCSADVGGHLYSGVPDPWHSARYTVARGREECLSPGAGERVRVRTGLGAEDLLGRAVVVHDSVGARIACGVLHAMVN